jgi:excinuclease ABC subunit A
MPEAKIRGYGPGRFSFNVKGGRCEACEGDGLVKIEMHFLPDVYVPCDVCKGKRYNRETLEVRFRGLSIADTLELTVEDALEFFENQPRLFQKLQTLNDVGLGYIHLGQSATTLSGGEAQRVKLATELSKRDTGRTFYILDEPTTGLHFEDVRMLLGVLHRLVDRGNTVLVIEHNLDVIKTADWIIDLGPEGGLRGGDIVAAGTPEDVARVEKSHTGRYLKPLLKKHSARKAG